MSAGPPAKMNDTNMPFPSSPPTMLKPSPEVLFLKIIFLGSLKEQTKTTCLISHVDTNLLDLDPSVPAGTLGDEPSPTGMIIGSLPWFGYL